MHGNTLIAKAVGVVLTAFSFAFSLGFFVFSTPPAGASAATGTCVVQPTQSVDPDSGLTVVTASESASCEDLKVDLVRVGLDGSREVMSSSVASPDQPAEFRFGPVPAGYASYEFVLADGQLLHTVTA